MGSVTFEDDLDLAGLLFGVAMDLPLRTAINELLDRFNSCESCFGLSSALRRIMNARRMSKTNAINITKPKPYNRYIGRWE